MIRASIFFTIFLGLACTAPVWLSWVASPAADWLAGLLTQVQSVDGATWAFAGISIVLLVCIFRPR
jgi:hypothetical protein